MWLTLQHHTQSNKDFPVVTVCILPHVWSGSLRTGTATGSGTCTADACGASPPARRGFFELLLFPLRSSESQLFLV